MHGKTSICRELLNMVPNSIILEGGNLYRAIVYALMNSGIELEELKKNMKSVDIKEIMEKLKVSIKIENRDTTIYINNEKIDEEKLQSKESSLAVSEIGKIADNKNLYLFGHKIIDEFTDNDWVEIEGTITKGYYHGEIPVIEIKSMKKIEKPSEEYVYPPDDSYVQTSTTLE